MRFLLPALLFVLTPFASAQNGIEPYSEVQIFVPNRTSLIELVDLAEIDHVHLEQTTYGYYVHATIGWSIRERLDVVGYRYEVLVDDVVAEVAVRGGCPTMPFGVPSGFFFGSMGCYPTLDEYEATFDDMHLQYPDLITQKESIGTTWEGRPIWVMRMSAAPNPENVPEVLYTGLHHAREPQSAAGLLYFMYYLLENYGIDPEATALLENRALYFIPILNPDGYRYNQTIAPNGGGLWRKNRRPIPGTSEFGVDLNRNYSYMWNCAGPTTSCTASSQTYAGPHAFSEAETQALREWLGTREIRATYNYHSFGNYWLHPFGYAPPHEDSDVYTVDHALYTDLSVEITQFNNYTYGLAGQVLYPARGTSDDWMYGEQSEKPKIYAFTPEIGGTDDFFWPSPNRIVPLSLDMLHPNLVLAWFVGVYPRQVLSSAFAEDVENGNGYLDPGENGLAYVEVENFGVGRIDNARARINSTDPKVMFEPGEWATFMISDTSNVTLPPLEFTLRPDAPLGTTNALIVELELEGGGVMPLVLNPLVIGSPLYLLDDPLDNSDSWSLEEWGLTTDAASPLYALTDSPNGDYVPGSTNTLQLAQPLDLSGAEDTSLHFNAKWDIASDTDFLQVRVSTDGDNWEALRGMYTVIGSGDGVQPLDEPGYAGFRSDWILETINLSAYDGVPALYLQFQMRAASENSADGFYLDDVQVIGGLYNGNTVGNETGEDLRANVILHAPYPNPVQGITHLRFHIPEAGEVEIRVFDLLGRQVIQLIDGAYTPGGHTISWDTSNAQLVPGHYLVELRASGVRAVQRIVVVR